MIEKADGIEAEALGVSGGFEHSGPIATRPKIDSNFHSELFPFKHSRLIALARLVV